MELKTLIAPGLVAMALAACGGGGDDAAGSPTAFSVQPASITLTAVATTSGGPPTGQCSAGYAGDVFLYGGAAPYRLDNTSPGAVLLHRSASDFTPVSTVSDRGGSFSVSYGSSCFAPVTVIIVDKLDNQTVLTLNNRPAGAAAP